jgi:hypothetical protein
MLCTEVICDCCVNHTKHPDTLCGQTGELLGLNHVCYVYYSVYFTWLTNMTTDIEKFSW